MVMRGDLNLAVLQLLHRMIPAMVSKLQLEGFPAQRDAGELMSQTNAKDWHSSHEPPNAVHCISTRFWISRTIRQKYAIGLQRHHIFRQSLRRNHRHSAALPSQLAQN